MHSQMGKKDGSEFSSKVQDAENKVFAISPTKAYCPLVNSLLFAGGDYYISMA